jgi:hypothetical protein
MPQNCARSFHPGGTKAGSGRSPTQDRRTLRDWVCPSCRRTPCRALRDCLEIVSGCNRCLRERIVDCPESLCLKPEPSLPL